MEVEVEVKVEVKVDVDVEVRWSGVEVVVGGGWVLGGGVCGEGMEGEGGSQTAKPLLAELNRHLHLYMAPNNIRSSAWQALSTCRHTGTRDNHSDGWQSFPKTPTVHQHKPHRFQA